MSLNNKERKIESSIKALALNVLHYIECCVRMKTKQIGKNLTED